MASTVPEQAAPSGKSDTARNVLLLPSHLFFVRAIDLPAGISPDELPAFVELSLEEISPFAINQLYYGYYLPAGGDRLLVFAAYRKQLAAYEGDGWAEADLVLPDFAAVLGINREGGALVFLEDKGAVTAIYWSDGDPVPERVLSRGFTQAEEQETGSGSVRKELCRRMEPFPDDLTIHQYTAPSATIRDRNVVFELEREGTDEPEKLSVDVPSSECLSMDIRDKAFLNAARIAQRQNRWLWAGVMTLCAGFLALAIFEAALFAGRHFVDRREANVFALEPEVERVRQQEDLANRLAELSGERLLPFEMIAFLNRYRPPSIYYTRTVANGLRSFEIEARTPRSEDVDRFQRLLENDRNLESVEIRNLRLRAQDGLSSFTIAGTFREGALTNFSRPPQRSVAGVPVLGENPAALPPLPPAENHKPVADDINGEEER